MDAMTTETSGTLLFMAADGKEYEVVRTRRQQGATGEHDGADVLALLFEKNSLVDGAPFRLPAAETVVDRVLALNGRSNAMSRTQWLFDRPMFDFMSEIVLLAPDGGTFVFDRAWEHQRQQHGATSARR